MSAHKQRVSVFLAVALRHLVNCQSQGWISEKKRLKRKISREKYQEKNIKISSYKQSVFMVTGRLRESAILRQQEVYSVNNFFVPLGCSTVAAIRLALANHDGDANENVTKQRV